MSTSQIPYDRLVRSALLGVVRQVLTDAATQGLPGEHHFYVGFRTNHPGVVLPPYLRARYPNEMVIVLQNRYWGLEVMDETFAVGLSFGGVPERLVIPFDALTAFSDPAVEFGLSLQQADAADTYPPGDPEESTRFDLDVESAPPVAGDPEPAKPADIVSLDAFRKR